MTAWTPSHLATIGGAGELELASRRLDGTLRSFVTMWVVAVAIDAAYHAKYDRFGARIVGSVVGPAAHTVTLRVTPTENTQERNTP